MSLIEFFLVAASILIALSLGRLLEGLYVVSESKAWSWVHGVWLLNKLANCVLLMWAWRVIISGEIRSPDNFTDFLLVIGSPAIIYLQAIALVGLAPDGTRDWSAHFYSIRRRFFALNCALMVAVMTTSVRLGTTDRLALTPYLVVLAFSIVGFLSPSPRVQAVLAVVAALNLVLGIGAPLVRSG